MTSPYDLISDSEISVYDGPDGPTGDQPTLVRNRYRKILTQEGTHAICHQHWDEPFSWPDDYEESVEIYDSEQERDAAWKSLASKF